MALDSSSFTGSDLHRWLFRPKDGQKIEFTQRNMPFAVFKPHALWGGTCLIGDIKCDVWIQHNDEGEKGKRLEIYFPHKLIGQTVPIEKTTHVGYMKIEGSWQKGTGKCFFEFLNEKGTPNE